MDIKPYWEEVRKIFSKAGKSSGHVTMATINENGTPHVMPIGSLMLYDDCRGVYCEVFSKTFEKNLGRDPRVSFMAVNNSFVFWVKSLLRGKFNTSPCIRLMGKAGERRKGTPEEMARWQKRVRIFKWTKGYNLLWKDITYVRDVYFDSFEPVRAGKMTRDLW